MTNEQGISVLEKQKEKILATNRNNHDDLFRVLEQTKDYTATLLGTDSTAYKLVASFRQIPTIDERMYNERIEALLNSLIKCLDIAIDTITDFGILANRNTSNFLHGGYTFEDARKNEEMMKTMRETLNTILNSNEPESLKKFKELEGHRLADERPDKKPSKYTIEHIIKTTKSPVVIWCAKNIWSIIKGVVIALIAAYLIVKYKPFH